MKKKSDILKTSEKIGTNKQTNKQTKTKVKKERKQRKSFFWNQCRPIGINI